MTHEKNKNIIYSNMEYNRYKTGDRNQNLGGSISKFCDHDNYNKTAIYNYWGMKPKFCFDHKDKYHVNISKNIYSVFIITYRIHKKQNVINVKLKNQQNAMNVRLQLVIILKN